MSEVNENNLHSEKTDEMAVELTPPEVEKIPVVNDTVETKENKPITEPAETQALVGVSAEKTEDVIEEQPEGYSGVVSDDVLNGPAVELEKLEEPEIADSAEIPTKEGDAKISGKSDSSEKTPVFFKKADKKDLPKEEEKQKVPEELHDDVDVELEAPEIDEEPAVKEPSVESAEIKSDIPVFKQEVKTETPEKKNILVNKREDAPKIENENRISEEAGILFSTELEAPDTETDEDFDDWDGEEIADELSTAIPLAIVTKQMADKKTAKKEIDKKQSNDIFKKDSSDEVSIIDTPSKTQDKIFADNKDEVGMGGRTVEDSLFLKPEDPEKKSFVVNAKKEETELFVNKKKADEKSVSVKGPNTDKVQKNAAIKTATKKEGRQEELATAVGLSAQGGGGGRVIDKAEELLGATEATAKKAAEASKAVGRASKSAKIKEVVKEKINDRDWTNVADAVKKSQDTIWGAPETMESISTSAVKSVAGAGGDGFSNLRGKSNQSDYEVDVQDLDKAGDLGKSGAESGSEKGREGVKSFINAPGDAVSQAGSAYSKKKQISKRIQKHKEKQAEKLKAKTEAQKAAVDAANTEALKAKMVSPGTSSGANGAVQTGSAATTQTAAQSAQISSHMAAEGSRQAAQSAATATAATTAENAATTTAATTAATSTAATEASAGPPGWIALIVEAAIILTGIVIALIMIVSIMLAIIAIFGGSEDEDGLATSEQRVALQKHMFTMLAVYDHEGKVLVGGGEGSNDFDTLYAEALNCAEFSSSEVSYSNVPHAATVTYEDDSWGEKKFYPNSYSVLGNINSDWCAWFASYTYSNGGYDLTTNSAEMYMFYNSGYNFSHMGFTTNDANTSGHLKFFVKEGHVIPYGDHLDSGKAYVDYLPTVGDMVFKANDATWTLGANSYYDDCLNCCPSHVEIVLAVDYTNKVFYTINGNAAHAVGIKKYYIRSGSGAMYSYETWRGYYSTSICAFGRVCSRPEEAYSY